MSSNLTKLSVKVQMALLMLFCLLMSMPSVKAQQSLPAELKDSVYTILGDPDPSVVTQTQYFTVPQGVHFLKIQCWGAGAAGAYMNPAGLFKGWAGAGGGGGAYARVNKLAVTPGQVLTVVIGQGGYGSSNIHGYGGDSYVQYKGATVVLAKGAAEVANDQYTVAGLGGSKNDCVGDVKWSGGNGGKGISGDYSGSGAGGGAAGTTHDGYKGGDGIQPAYYSFTDHPSTGGAPGDGYPFTAPNTGYGANGIVSHYGTNGNNAANYAAGGSGASGYGVRGNGFGGDGGDGVVIITYEVCQVDAGSIKAGTGCVVTLLNDVEASGSTGSYFWQKSNDRYNWTTIKGASNKDYTPTETGYYRRGYNADCGNTVYTTDKHAEVYSAPNPGSVALYGQPDEMSYSTCKGEEVSLNLSAYGTDGTTLIWQSSADNGQTWQSVDTLEVAIPINVYSDSIIAPVQYRYYFEPSTACKVYSNNTFSITIDTGVVTRLDFFFDTSSVHFVLQYGESEMSPFISAPTFRPLTGVTLSNNVSTKNYGQLLGSVGVGTYTIDWMVSDCGGSKTYTKTYTVSYPACDSAYTIMDADGNEYNTVRIGTECWTRENLRALHYNNNDTIFGSSIYMSAKYNDTLANLATYGRLYSWYAAAKLSDSLSVPVKNIFGRIEGVCPEGWIIPTEAQYQELTSFVSKDLRSTILWLDGEGTDLTRLTMLPGGCYNAVSGRCEDLLGYAYFWTDQELANEKSFAFWVDCHCYQIQKKEYNKNNGMSIRCIKEKTPSAPTVVTLPVTNIDVNTATLNGNVADDGMLAITERGFCYSPHPMPTMQSAVTVRDAATGTGEYSIPVTGLTYNIRYYVRAYAVNALDTSYGKEISFVPTLPTDTIRFEGNGGLGLMTPQLTLRGVSTPLKANNFFIPLCAFAGWSLTPESEVVYTNRQPIQSNGNMTLYAQWYRPTHKAYTQVACDSYTWAAPEGNDSTYTKSGNYLYKHFDIHGCTQVDTLHLTINKSVATDFSDSNCDSYTWNDSTYTTSGDKVQHFKTVQNCDSTVTLHLTIYKSVATQFTDNGCESYTWNDSTYTTSGDKVQYFKTVHNCDSTVTLHLTINKSVSETVKDTICTNILPYNWRDTTFAVGTTTGDYVFNRRTVKGCDSTVTLKLVVKNCYDTITFMPNGAKGGTMEKQAVVIGTATALNANQYTHGAPEAPDTNWAFMGWNTDALGNGTSYAAGASITTNGNVTLHAQWHTWCNGTAITGESGSTGRVDSVQDIDGNSYKVVQIGDQCWLKENLKTTRYANGNPISSTSPSTATSDTTAYWYYPNGEASNVKTYGLLYNWPAVMNGSSSSNANPSGVQGICPNGWHVPSDPEFTQLTNYVTIQSEYVCGTNSTSIAKALASTTLWNKSNSSCMVGNTPSANNGTGFTAVPADKYNNGSGDFGKYAHFWSATQESSGRAYFKKLSSNSKTMYSNYSPMKDGFSVRCVRDVAIKDTITFMPNGATGSTMDKQVVTRGVATALNANQFTHTAPDANWAFEGWNTDALGNGTSYAAGANITTNGNVTLHAQWHTWCNGTAVTANGEMGTGRVDSVQDVDGNSYKVVQIGNQCWLKENLKTTRYANGNNISWKYPNDNASNKDVYGLFYSWSDVMNNGPTPSTANPSGVQGVCPNGWHLPSDAEFTQLADHVKSKSGYQCNSTSNNIAKALASTTLWISNSNLCAVANNQSTNNATGFTAVPAGNYGYSFGAEAYFWSTTKPSTSSRGCLILYNNNASVSIDSTPINFRNSVRCVRNPQTPE